MKISIEADRTPYSKLNKRCAGDCRKKTSKSYYGINKAANK
jgi:hypothetical protein